jgi:hypothetical protein
MGRVKKVTSHIIYTQPYFKRPAIRSRMLVARCRLYFERFSLFIYIHIYMHMRLRWRPDPDLCDSHPDFVPSGVVWVG